MCVCVCVYVRVCVRERHVSQVRVDETKDLGLFSVTRLGVVTASPDTFTLLTDSCTLHPAVLCVYSGGVCRFGQEVSL